MATDFDEALMAELGQRWRKVALVLSLAAEKVGQDSDDALGQLAKRLEALVADGKVEAQGDLSRWRHSEVRRRA